MTSGIQGGRTLSGSPGLLEGDGLGPQVVSLNAWVGSS